MVSPLGKRQVWWAHLLVLTAGLSTTVGLGEGVTTPTPTRTSFGLGLRVDAGGSVSSSGRGFSEVLVDFL